MKNISPRLAGLVMVALATLAPVAAFADGSTPTPLDTTGYSAIFTQLQSDMTTVATGPVGVGAFTCLTVGIIFKVVWRLYKKSGNAVG